MKASTITTPMTSGVAVFIRFAKSRLPAASPVTSAWPEGGDGRAQLLDDLLGLIEPAIRHRDPNRRGPAISRDVYLYAPVTAGDLATRAGP